MNYSKKESKKEKKQEIDAKKRKTWNEDEKRSMKMKDTVNQCPESSTPGPNKNISGDYSSQYGGARVIESDLVVCFVKRMLVF
jgi:hypothetical protein